MKMKEKVKEKIKRSSENEERDERKNVFFWKKMCQSNPPDELLAQHVSKKKNRFGRNILPFVLRTFRT